jgi:general stress protein YciG
MIKQESVENKGGMSVREAGRKGGIKTSKTHDHKHYQTVGKLGGQKMAWLVAKGKAAEQDDRA